MSARSAVRTTAYVVFCALLASCADRATDPIAGHRGNQTTTPTIDAQIDALIASLYTGGARTSVTARWSNVKRQDMRNLSGRTQLVQLIDWIRKKPNDVHPASGETADHAIARLSLLMSLRVYGGETTPPPVVTPDADVALTIVDPAQPDTVVTPSQHAAVAFPAGAVSEQTVVVVEENPQYYPENCSGPLPTTRCQYPRFYKYNVFPDVKLNTPATVAVCHINTGASREPLVDHDHLRFAHNKPTDPSANIAGGYIEGDIEVLPTVSANLVDCENNAYTPPTSSSAMGRLLNPVTRLAMKVGKFFSVKNAWAIDQGAGGDVSEFSDFAVIDPTSSPDLTPAQSFDLSSFSVARGASITVNSWTVHNTGTGTGLNFGTAIVLAQDTGLTSGIQLNLAQPVIGSLAPGATQSSGPLTVSIPASVPAGHYYLGVVVDDGNAVTESDESNNFVSWSIEVTDPYTLFCPDGPAGSYADLDTAIAHTASGGIVKVCDGMYDVDTVKINKPLELTSEHPGLATLRDVLVAPAIQGGRPAIIIDGVASGTVLIHDIKFEMRGRAIGIGRPAQPVGPPPPNNTGWVHPGVFDQVIIDHVQFHGSNANTTAVQVFQAPLSTAKVEVTYSTFTNHGLGVFATAHVETNVRHSTFANFAAGSVTYSGFRPDTTGVFSKYSFGTMEYNNISGCGSTGCVRAVEMVGGSIQHNQIDGTGTSVKQFGILVTPPPDATGHDVIQILDNQISATFLGGDPNQAANYTLTNGISVGDQTGVATSAHFNTITNAFNGVNIAAAFNGGQNVITGGFAGLVQSGTRAIEFHRNDLTGQVRSFQVLGAGAVPGHFTCNYWGTITGPFNFTPTTTPSTVYTPFSTVPIANHPEVVCP